MDKQYGHWMEAWSVFNMYQILQVWLVLVVLEVEQDFKIWLVAVGLLMTKSPTPSGVAVAVPLQFWFCRNPGLALPLIALQYHEQN